MRSAWSGCAQIWLNDFMVSHAAERRITGGIEDYCARLWS